MCPECLELGQPSSEQILKQINDTTWGARQVDASQQTVVLSPRGMTLGGQMSNKSKSSNPSTPFVLPN